MIFIDSLPKGSLFDLLRIALGANCLICGQPNWHRVKGKVPRKPDVVDQPENIGYIKDRIPKKPGLHEYATPALENIDITAFQRFSRLPEAQRKAPAQPVEKNFFPPGRPWAERAPKWVSRVVTDVSTLFNDATIRVLVTRRQ
jgi:hypothetical protein